MTKIIRCPRCKETLFFLCVGGFSTHLIAYCKGCKLPVEIRRMRSGKLYSVAWKRD